MKCDTCYFGTTIFSRPIEICVIAYDKEDISIVVNAIETNSCKYYKAHPLLVKEETQCQRKDER